LADQKKKEIRSKKTAYAKIWNRKAYAKNPEIFKMRTSARRALIPQFGKEAGFVLGFVETVRAKKSIRCYYCGEKMSGKRAHIDHVFALSKGGNHASSNVCASCPTCNLSKQAKSLNEWSPKTNQSFLPL
jgi:5-methylcytosine-specific restriction endonuclease McrA